MEIKRTQLIPMGMNQDLSISKFTPNLSFSNRNIRITARDASTLMSIENERGNYKIPLLDSNNNHVEMQGTCIGYAVLNKYLVLFTTSLVDNETSLDRIYRLDDSFQCILLFEGNLGFDLNHLIEAIPYYETESVQKVYWTDGKNPLRVINIVSEDIGTWTNTSFNFSQYLDLEENVTIEKLPTGGQFASGVIQYALTYFNANGVESNIFYSSELYYLSTIDRALSPEEVSPNAFRITVENIDPKFEYVRLYSVQRTSLEGTPTVKIVTDQKITGESIVIIDNGRTGSDLDPTALLYVGGEELIAGTITTKDNTFFAGNLKIQEDIINMDDLLASMRHQVFKWEYRDPVTIDGKEYGTNANYTYSPISLNYKSSKYKHFKNGQLYRLGVQFQYKNGKWSSPVYRGGNHYSHSHDELCTLPPITKKGDFQTELYLNKGVLTLDQGICNILYQKGYRKVRPVMVIPDLSDRSVLAQGIVTSTLGFSKLRVQNIPWAFNDYLSRPYTLNQNYNTTLKESGWNNRIPTSGHYLSPLRGNEFESYTLISSDNPSGSSSDWNYVNVNNQYKIPFRFMMSLDESAGDYDDYKGPISNIGNILTSNTTNLINIDENLVTFWSPDVEKYETLGGYLDDSVYLTIAGLSMLGSSASSQNATIEAATNIYGESSSSSFISNYERSTDEIFARAAMPMGMTATINYSDGSSDNLRTHAPVPIFSEEQYTYGNNTQDIKSYALKTKNVGIFQYSTHNLMFDTTSADLSFQINKPSQLLSDVSSIPYTSSSYDNKGNLAYSAQPDELFSADGDIMTLPTGVKEDPYGGDRHIKPTVFKFKSNTHVLFSFKDFPINSGGSLMSRVLPGFTQKTSRMASTRGAQAYTTYKVQLITSALPQEANNPNVNYGYPTRINYVVNYQLQDSSGTVVDKIPQGSKLYLQFKMSYSDPDKYKAGVIEVVETTTLQYELKTASGTADIGALVTAQNEAKPIPLCTIGTQTPIIIDYYAGLEYSSPKSIVCTYQNEEYNYAEAKIENLTQAPNINIPDYQDPGVITGEIKQYDRPYWRESGAPGYYKNLLNVNDYKVDNPNNVVDNLPFFILAELRKPNINPYGGFTEAAINNNLWTICGPSVKLETSQDTNVEFIEGDTFVRRYDCLRAYSDTSATQKLASVTSFLCESFINMDGRYDRNRYTIDVRNRSPETYNLVNDVYSQNNDYFNYRSVDSEIFKNVLFPTQVVWSQAKNNGEITDTWTNLVLASSIDLDGSLGSINSLKTLDSELVSFQDRGIANILFNSRVQIPTSDNIPIEISNNYKVSGYRYITNSIGCRNKWSINKSKKGLYFFDDFNKNIHLLSGQGLQNLSIEKGFKAWSNNNIKDVGNTTLYEGMSNFITSIDKVQDDIYFTNLNYCLNYSEILGNFISFFDYNNIPFMFNYLDHFMAIKNDLGKTYLYCQNVGKFNEFFGDLYPSEIDYIVNPEFPLDKVFNNLEFRADCFKKEIDAPFRITQNDNYRITQEDYYRVINGGTITGYTYLPWRTLDKVECENEFQYGVWDFKTDKDKYQLKKKFRIWRCALPRQQGTLNRIRNPWTHLKLSYRPDSFEDNRLILHDIIVNYTI